MKEVAVSMNVDTKKAIQNMEKLGVEIEEAKGLTLELREENLKLQKQINAKPNARQLTELKKQLKTNTQIIKENNLAIAQRNRKLAKIKSTVNATKKTKQLTKANSGLLKSISQLNPATNTLFTRFGNLSQGLGKATSGWKKLGLAMLGTGIGAIVIALGSLVTYLRSSEEGQNRLTKAMKIAGAVIANVTETVSKLGEGLLNVGKALFFGGKGFLGNLKAAGKEIGKTYDNVSEKISTIGDDIKEDIKTAKEIADALARADKIDRKLQVERQKANVKINDLRTKAYDTERFNNQERIKFLEEAVRIEDRITNKEIEAARLRFEAKKKENAMTTLVRKEDLDEEARLEAKLSELEAKKLNRQKEVSNQRQMILRKEQREKQKILDQELKDFQDFLQKKTNLELAEIEKLGDLRRSYAQKNQEKEDIDEAVRIEMKRAKALEELNALQIAEGFKGQARFEINKYFDGLITENTKKEGEEKIKLEDDVHRAKMDLAMKGLSLIQAVAGKGSKIGKAAAIAQATISGIESTINAFKTANASPVTTVFPAYPYIQAGLAAGFAAVNIAKIKSAKTGGGGSSPSTAVGNRGAQASTPPDFNIVGSNSQNQLAETIAGKENKPQKAYVVSSEVSNAQALDRNIVEGASIG